jgi:hypothetical protein
MEDKKIKQILSGGWYQWEGGEYKERMKEDGYRENIMYSWYIPSTFVNVTMYPQFNNNMILIIKHQEKIHEQNEKFNKEI